MTKPNVWSILNGSADEMGWNTDSRLAVVMDFLNQEVSIDRLIRERFQRYLDERVVQESGELEEEDFEPCPNCPYLGMVLPDSCDLCTVGLNTLMGQKEN